MAEEVWGGPPIGPAEAQARLAPPEVRSVADDQQQERRQPEAPPEHDRHERRGRVHLGIAHLRQLAVLAGRAPARRLELAAPVGIDDGPRLDGGLCGGAVWLASTT